MESENLVELYNKPLIVRPNKEVDYMVKILLCHCTWHLNYITKPTFSVRHIHFGLLEYAIEFVEFYELMQWKNISEVDPHNYLLNCGYQKIFKTQDFFDLNIQELPMAQRRVINTLTNNDTIWVIKTPLQIYKRVEMLTKTYHLIDSALENVKPEDFYDTSRT